MPKNTYQTVEKPFFSQISLSEVTSQFPANQSPEVSTGGSSTVSGSSERRSDCLRSTWRIHCEDPRWESRK